MDNNQKIIDSGDLRKYRIEIPNLADDELGPYEFRLYAHYKRVAGQSGACWENLATTAEKCRMSRTRTIQARNWLERHGWIACEQERDDRPIVVRVLDIWPLNFTRYCSPDLDRGSPDLDRGSPDLDRGSPDLDSKNKPYKKEPTKKEPTKKELTDSRSVSRFAGVDDLLAEFDPEDVERALAIAEENKAKNRIRYAAGTLLNWRDDRQAVSAKNGYANKRNYIPDEYKHIICGSPDYDESIPGPQVTPKVDGAGRPINLGADHADG